MSPLESQKTQKYMKAFTLDSVGQKQREIKKHFYKGICVDYFRSEKSTSIGASMKCDKSYLGITQNVLILQIIFRNLFLKICPKL